MTKLLFYILLLLPVSSCFCQSDTLVYPSIFERQINMDNSYWLSTSSQDSIAQYNNELFENKWKQLISNAASYYPFKTNDFSENKWFHLYYHYSLEAFEQSRFLINENLMKNHVLGDIKPLRDDFLYSGSDDSFAYYPEEVFFLTSSLIKGFNDPYIMSHSDFIRNFDSIPKYIKALIINSDLFRRGYDNNKIISILEKFDNVEYIEILDGHDEGVLSAVNFVLGMPILKNLKYLYIPNADNNHLTIINEKCLSLKALWVGYSEETIEELPNKFLSNTNIHFLVLNYGAPLKGNELDALINLQTLVLRSDAKKGGINSSVLNSMTKLRCLVLSISFFEPSLYLTNTKLEEVFLSFNRSKLIEIKNAKHLRILHIQSTSLNDFHVKLTGVESIESIFFLNQDGGGIKLTINSKIENLNTVFLEANSVEFFSKKKLPEGAKLSIGYIQNCTLPKSRKEDSNNTDIIQYKPNWRGRVK